MGWLCVGVCDGLCGEARILCGCKRQNTWSLNVLRVTGNPRDAATTDHFPGWEGGVCALGKKKKIKKEGKPWRVGWGQGPARELPRPAQSVRSLVRGYAELAGGPLCKQCARRGRLPSTAEATRVRGSFLLFHFQIRATAWIPVPEQLPRHVRNPGAPSRHPARPHVALLLASISDTPLPERQCAARGHSFGDSESE